jgi:hypothetical protein
VQLQVGNWLSEQIPFHEAAPDQVLAEVILPHDEREKLPRNTTDIIGSLIAREP